MASGPAAPRTLSMLPRTCPCRPRSWPRWRDPTSSGSRRSPLPRACWGQVRAASPSPREVATRQTRQGQPTIWRAEKVVATLRQWIKQPATAGRISRLSYWLAPAASESAGCERKQTDASDPAVLRFRRQWLRRKGGRLIAPPLPVTKVGANCDFSSSFGLVRAYGRGGAGRRDLSRIRLGCSTRGGAGERLGSGDLLWRTIHAARRA